MCPHCGEPLIIYELNGVEIDHCLSCGGTWLDDGELEILAELEGAEPGEVSNALYQAEALSRSTRRCPRCSRKMDTITVGESNIELERCHYNHGLWFDKGEMIAIMDLSHDTENDHSVQSGGEQGVVAQFFANLYKTELKSEVEEK